MAIFPLYTLSIVLFLCLFHQSSHCQQAYISDSQYFNCSVYTSTSKGYLCNGLELCESFVTFKSQPPYDTAISIAHLLGSEASSIASFNNIYDTDKIPSNKLIIVPVSCSCAGNLYRHFVPYTIKPGDKYSNSIYQGLTTCQVMIGQYYYDPESLPVGTELMVPVRCACPTLNQTMRGVTSLVAYMVRMGDNVSLIADTFGVDAQSIFEANMLPEDRIIASTPLLVPLKGKTCTRKSDSNFFFNCPGGYLTDGGKCIPDGTKLPVKRLLYSVALSFSLTHSQSLPAGVCVI
ncbi:Protein LYK5 [Morella rubra]|uniref:Protein LYK5 n=1 Tax=Morella rubra TaxID=262757 RepID=A0A6A1V168_9ROSI|nr:Protein LYK5 [Morella rubra]